MERLGVSYGGMVGDFVNQKLIQGKTWKNYNVFTTITNGAFGGASLFEGAAWGASGSFLNLSYNDITDKNRSVSNFNKSGLISFAAGFVGNVVSGGLTNRFKTLTGLADFGGKGVILSTRVAANSILITVDAANNTWGNIFAKQVESEIDKMNK